MEKIKLLDEIKTKINEIQIFDTHEHLLPEIERRNSKLDFFYFFTHYASTDLISSGMDEDDLLFITNPENNIEKKWKIFEPFWNQIKNTMYSKIILIIVKDLFAIDSIDLKNIIKISEKLEKTKEIEYYDHILLDKCNIKHILIDNDCNHLNRNYDTINKDYLLPVTRLDMINMTTSLEKIYELEEKYNLNIYKLAHFVDLIDRIFESRKNTHYALKIGVAYKRTLFFDDVTYSDAEKDFLKIFKLKNYSGSTNKDSLSKDDLKKFQDYIYRYSIEKAIEYDMPIQIHTGLLEGNRNDILNSNPTLLTNLLLKYKKAKFDFFHVAYPFTDELIAMLKMFKNLYINMAWVPEISKILYKNTLNLLIETIPSNKVIGFGGDYEFVEGIYGAQKIAREAIAEVIYDRLNSGYFNFDEGIEYADKILFRNSHNIYLN